jgi:hypothetical protein
MEALGICDGNGSDSERMSLPKNANDRFTSASLIAMPCYALALIPDKAASIP